MPNYRMRVLNAEFISEDDGRDYPNRDSAVEQSIDAAAGIAHDMVRGGAASAAVEVRLEEDGRLISRHLVTLSTLSVDGIGEEEKCDMVVARRI